MNLITQSLKIVQSEKYSLKRSLRWLESMYKTKEARIKSRDISNVEYAINRFKEVESRIIRLLEEYDIPL